MTLQINPWDDTYENQLSVEEKIREKRIALELLRKEQRRIEFNKDTGRGDLHTGPHEVEPYNKQTGPAHEEDWMYFTDCPLCGKDGLLRIDYPVCTSCQYELNPYAIDTDDKSWYAKVRPIKDTKIKCSGKKYAVLHTMSITDELGFRRVVGKQSQITHFVTQEEEKLVDVLDNQCTECFTKIWKENTCHMCLKESSQVNHDLCKACQKENPRYDPRESLIDQKLELEVGKGEAKKSLQKRKDYYAKTDAQEQLYLESERMKNEAKCSRLPKKRKSKGAKNDE
jgi:hypothetical protein